MLLQKPDGNPHIFLFVVRKEEKPQLSRTNIESFVTSKQQVYNELVLSGI